MKHIATLTLGLLLVTGAQADVTIQVPDDVQILAVNATQANLEGGLFSSTKTLVLANGENQVVFRYTPYFSQGNDRVIVESDAVISKFTAQDQRLNIELPQYRNAQEAEKQITEWQVTLVDQGNQTLNIKQDVLRKNGLQIGRDFVQESQAYNLTNGIAALNTDAAVAATLPASMAANGNINSNTAEEMLHFWYQKADHETRMKFKQYINQDR